MGLWNKITDNILNIIDLPNFSSEGAYSLRHNGVVLCQGDTEFVKIRQKTDKPGMDVFITIISGCGIHNSGCNENRHDGIHSFHVQKSAAVRYEEKHYGEGDGTGAKVLNPTTNIYLSPNSSFIMDTAQIRGVDSTHRETFIELEENAKLQVIEKLMTDGTQSAVTNMEVVMNGSDSSAQIISRSVAKGTSVQTFHPKAIGKALCHAHIQCDSIIMDQAEVCSIPEINARHLDAAIIHEAAIGRINDEQVMKLRTLGMTAEEAESIIIENFLGES